MTKKSKPEFRVNSIAGCALPEKPFTPTNGNSCSTCHIHSDVTCHDFPKKKRPRRQP